MIRHGSNVPIGASEENAILFIEDKGYNDDLSKSGNLLTNYLSYSMNAGYIIDI